MFLQNKNSLSKILKIGLIHRTSNPFNEGLLIVDSFYGLAVFLLEPFSLLSNLCNTYYLTIWKMYYCLVSKMEKLLAHTNCINISHARFYSRCKNKRNLPSFLFTSYKFVTYFKTADKELLICMLKHGQILNKHNLGFSDSACLAKKPVAPFLYVFFALVFP